jgi:hypothetical protein
MVARSPPPSAIPWRRPGAPRASRSSMLPPGSHARRSRRRAGSCSRSPTAPMEPSSRRRARTAAYASGPRRSRRVHPRESSGSRRASSSARSCLAASSGRSGAPLVRELRAARWQGSRGQLGVRAAASTASGRARGPGQPGLEASACLGSRCVSGVAVSRCCRARRRASCRRPTRRPASACASRGHSCELACARGAGRRGRSSRSRASAS